MKAKLKPKYKFAIFLTIFLVFVNTMIFTAPAKAAKPSSILMIDFKAKGDDLDVPGAITTIKGRIEYNEATGEGQGQVVFHLKLYDESGKKVYSMMGMLKSVVVMRGFEFPCSVRDLTWTNLWFVMGEGKIKTTGKPITMEYRGIPITLPNTEGRYNTTTVGFMVSSNGEFEQNGDEEGEWDQGGWAFAGIPGFFGGVTLLTKFTEKWVP
jgi:hypothetical protein